MPSPIKSRTWRNAFGQVKGELLPFCFKTWDAKSWKKCVHVLKDQVMKGQKSNTDKAKFWTMLMVTAMNQSYLKDWEAKPIETNMSGWTWIQALNFWRTHLHHIENNLKSLSDHACQCKTCEAKSWSAFKIHYCAKTISGRPSPNRFCRLGKWPSLNFIFNFHI